RSGCLRSCDEMPRLRKVSAGREPVPPSDRRIIVLATAWGPRYGGINSFNYDLCCALPEILAEHDVVCVALSASDADMNDAAAANVTLVSLGREHDHEFEPSWCDQVCALLSSTISLETIDWFIGHDIKSGELALE